MIHVTHGFISSVVSAMFETNCQHFRGVTARSTSACEYATHSGIRALRTGPAPALIKTVYSGVPAKDPRILQIVRKICGAADRAISHTELAQCAVIADFNFSINMGRLSVWAKTGLCSSCSNL